MKNIVLCFLLAVCAVGCNLPEGGVSSHAAPQAWIDAPLEGARLPLAPYPVVFHCADPAGVLAGELSVNGQVLASPANPESGQHLVVFQFDWTPPGPGEYTLQVRTRNSSQAWSDYSEVHVNVGDVPTLTQTSTPTRTPTDPETREFTNLSSPNQAYRGNCRQNQVTFQVRVNPAGDVTGMLVFTRLDEYNGSGSTGWDSGAAMAPLGGGLYQLTVNAASIRNSASYPVAVLLYQFVATGQGGGVLSRGPVYSDIHLGACGLQLVLPLFVSTETATPQVVK